MENTAVPRLKEALYQKEKVSAVESVGLLAILLLCVVTLSSNSYNPFIYFRFILDSIYHNKLVLVWKMIAEIVVKLLRKVWQCR